MTYPRSQGPTASEWQGLDFKPELADSCTLTTTVEYLLNTSITELLRGAVCEKVQ